MAQHAGAIRSRRGAGTPEISQPLEGLILGLLAKQPEDRPAQRGRRGRGLARRGGAAPRRGACRGQESAAPDLPPALDLAALAKLEEEAGAAEPTARGRAAACRCRAHRPSEAGPAAGQRRRPGCLAPGAHHAPHRPRGAGDALGRRALPDGALPGLLADRLAAEGDPAPPAARPPQRRPGAIPPGHHLRPGAAGPTEEAVQEAASLLDQRIDVRPALSPVVVAKYLSWRDTPPRRRLFRQTRKALQEASAYAQKSMTDDKGVLNPGLMPQSLDDLRKIAPARDLVDDVLVERWNRLAEVWRDHPEFRAAALRYASPQAHRDPASQALWPEVVYPLIELARWQRRFRTRAETLWDALVGRLFHVGDAGVELDRLLTRSVPAQVVAQIDDSVNLLAKKPPPEERRGAGPGRRDRPARTDRGRLARHGRDRRRPGAEG